mmetsp:Transcript_35487/g.96200  ORF Transcript_35487/g.96200 Transcript_35487/m.96200 type:complete len:290 (+) Transcript_35487:71-940(+)
MATYSMRGTTAAWSSTMPHSGMQPSVPPIDSRMTCRCAWSLHSGEPPLPCHCRLAARPSSSCSWSCTSGRWRAVRWRAPSWTLWHSVGQSSGTWASLSSASARRTVCCQAPCGSCWDGWMRLRSSTTMVHPQTPTRVQRSWAASGLASCACVGRLSPPWLSRRWAPSPRLPRWPRPPARLREAASQRLVSELMGQKLQGFPRHARQEGDKMVLTAMPRAPRLLHCRSPPYAASTGPTRRRCSGLCVGAFAPGMRIGAKLGTTSASSGAYLQTLRDLCRAPRHGRSWLNL